MIKLTGWPADEATPLHTVYVNPAHVVVLQPGEHGTIIALIGQPPIRVKEDIDTVALKMEHPVAWKH